MTMIRQRKKLYYQIESVRLTRTHRRQQRKNPKPGLFAHDETSPIFYVEIGISTQTKIFVRLTSFDCRFIPRRIDLDCDYALDTIVSQNLQIHSSQGENISIERQYRRIQKRSNQQVQANTSRKTLELLEHFMPQNRRIYNFGVKTLKPRPMGMKTWLLKIKIHCFSFRSMRSCASNRSINHHIQRTLHQFHT